MITTTDIKVQYDPVVATTEYAFEIGYFDDTDINVEVVDSDDVTTVLTLDAVEDGFSVEAVNGDPSSGATITTTESYEYGVTLTIYRETPTTQLVNFTRGGVVSATVLNTALDRNVAIVQEAKSDSSRSLICPVTDDDDITYELPSVETRKNKAVGFDDDGNATVLDLSDTGTVSVDSGTGLSMTSNIISIVTDSSLSFDSDGNLMADAIDTSALVDDAVTTAKIADETILATNIADSAITTSKLAVMDDSTVIGNMSGSTDSPTAIDVLDETDMATASETSLATQYSIITCIKAHANQVTNVITDTELVNESDDYTAVRIELTDTSITPYFNDSSVYINVSISLEASSNTTLFLYKQIGSDGWEILQGAPDYSSANCGMAIMVSDSNLGGTPQTISYQYLDEDVNSIELIQYGVGIRTNGNQYALNRSITDSGTSAYERGITTVTLKEIVTR